MKIKAFTIRNKKDNFLIFAQGVSSAHNICYFSLDQKWLTTRDIEESEGWSKDLGFYYFNEEIRHIFNYDYDLVKFNIEDVEIT